MDALNPAMAAKTLHIAIIKTSFEHWGRSPRATLERISQAFNGWAEADRVEVRGLPDQGTFDSSIYILQRLRHMLRRQLWALSPQELFLYHHRERRPLRDLLFRLKWAGVTALGTGDEGLSDNETKILYQIAEAVGLGYVRGDVVHDPFRSGTPGGGNPLHIEIPGYPESLWLDLAELCYKTRRVHETLPIAVRLDRVHPDAALLLGSAGANFVIVPKWEVTI